MSKMWKNVENVEKFQNFRKKYKIVKNSANCQKFGKISEIWKNVENLENPHNF